MDIELRACVDDSHLATIVADPVIRQIMARRGVSCANDLDLSTNALLPPSDLKDIDKAAQIIADAVINKKRVMIAGDYDIDGMSGTALGVRCLNAFGLDSAYISYRVPSRYDDGYGLSIKTVDEAIENNVDIIITVDNGISAFEAIEHAVNSGLTVVVTDHHEVQDKLPVAHAVVNPKRKDDNFASKHLSGVGVLYYVLIATRALLVNKGYFASRTNSPRMDMFLDLVALGTIGDVMSFDTNNRRLIKAGLKKIHEGFVSPGIKALLDILKIPNEKVTPRTFGFDLCPRFNAATRLKLDTNPAIETLLSTTYEEAHFYAKQLDLCNRRRMDHEKVILSRAIELFDNELLELEKSKSQGKDCSYNENAQIMAIYEEAAKAYERNKHDDSEITSDDFLDDSSEKNFETPQDINSVVLYDPCFLTGMVGLVANRMKERYNRPCIIFGGNFGAGALGGKIMMETIKPTFEEVKEAINKNPSIENISKLAEFIKYKGKLNDIGTDECDTYANEITIGHASFDQAIGHNLSAEALAKDQDKDSALKNLEKSLGFTPATQSNTQVASIDEAYALSKLDGQTKLVGSARSVPGVDLIEVFNYIKEREKDIFIACGGHSVAAGASIKACNFKRFKELFNEACGYLRKDKSKESGKVSDGVLPASYYCIGFARDLELMSPWGKDFEEPYFHGVFRVHSVNVLANRHAKFQLIAPNNKLIEAIKFRAKAQEKSIAPNIMVEAFFTVQVDRYHNDGRIQLTLDSIEPA